MCIQLDIVVHNRAQNSSDNLPSYPPDNHHSSDCLLEPGRKGNVWESGSFLYHVPMYQSARQKPVYSNHHTALYMVVCCGNLLHVSSPLKDITRRVDVEPETIGGLLSCVLLRQRRSDSVMRPTYRLNRSIRHTHTHTHTHVYDRPNGQQWPVMVSNGQRCLCI